MSKLTENLGLIKPELSDPADITAMNDNWDKIDEVLMNGVGSSANSAVVTLNSSDWVEGSDGRYYQTVTVADVTADTNVVMVDVDLSTDDVDAKIAYLEAWSLPAANEVDQLEGKLKFYAWDKPTVNIPVNVGVM